MQLTEIEYRSIYTGKLSLAVFDEDFHYIKREIQRMIDDGHTELLVMNNPRNYDFEGLIKT